MIKVNGSYISGATQFKLSGAYSAVMQYTKSGGAYVGQGQGASPLMIGALNQRFPWSAYGNATGCTKFQGRVPYQLADDTYSILLSDSAMVSSNNGNVNTGSFTIDAAYLECGALSIPLTKGGATSWTINSGEVDVHLDQIEAATLGFVGGIIPRGTVVWLRYKGTKANGATLPGSFVSQTMDGAIAMFWDPSAGGTVSSVSGIGPMTKTGTVFTNYEGYAPVMLARYVNNTKHVGVAIGDSLTWGSNDVYTSAVGTRGFGVPMRSQVGPTNADEYIPVLVIANPGNTADDLSTPNNQHEVFFKYATHGYEAMGTNDVGVNGANTSPSPSDTGTVTYGWVYGKKAAIWAAMRLYGLKVASMVLLPNTSSTDGYTTDTGQTVQTGWGPGGGAEAFRNYILAKKADGTLDYAVTYDSVRWPGKRWLWASAPDNAYHWGPVLQNLGAADLRAYWLS